MSLNTRRSSVAALTALLVTGLGVAATAAPGVDALLRRRRGQLRHLPDLGNRFVTSHDHARITGVAATPDGLVATVTSDASHTVVLNHDGTPEHASTGRTRTFDCAVSAQHLDELQPLIAAGTPLRITTTGLVALTGQVPTSWRIEPVDGHPLAHR